MVFFPFNSFKQAPIECRSKTADDSHRQMIDEITNRSELLRNRIGLLNRKKNVSSLFSHPLFKCKDEHGYDDNYYLTRGGSSESGFFSCLTDEDFSTHRPFAKLSINGPCDFDHQLPYIDDRSSTIPSSLRSFDDFDLFERNAKYDSSANDSLSIDMGLVNRLSLDSEINSLFHKNQLNNQLLYCKNRTSSIYTDSSEDISSLGGSDSLLWDDRMSSYSTTIPNTRSAQIAKIVEYFERKGQTFKNTTTVAAGGGGGGGVWPITKRPSESSKMGIQELWQPLTIGPDTLSTNSASNIEQRDPGVSCNRQAIHQWYATPPNNGNNAGDACANDHTSNNLTTGCGDTTKLITAGNENECTKVMSSIQSNRYQPAATALATTSKEYEAFCLDLDKTMATSPRLNVCEGAVKSKLQLFDKLRNN